MINRIVLFIFLFVSVSITQVNAEDQGEFLRNPANNKSYSPTKIVVTKYVTTTYVDTQNLVFEKARKAKIFFMNKGYSAKASAAIAGHLISESAMQTTIHGDYGVSKGLAQWNGQRLINLKRFAANKNKDWHDFEIQLEFIEYELQTTETLARDALIRSRNIVEATAAFMHFERPLGYSPYAPANGHGWGSRLYNANKLYVTYVKEISESHP